MASLFDSIELGVIQTPDPIHTAPLPRANHVHGAKGHTDDPTADGRIALAGDR